MTRAAPPGRHLLQAEIPADLAERLRARARANERTISAEARIALRLYLDGDVTSLPDPERGWTPPRAA